VMTVGDFHVNDALAKVAELGREPGNVRRNGRQQNMLSLR